VVEQQLGDGQRRAALAVGDPAEAGRRVLAGAGLGLTQRESEVLALTMAGLSNRTIAGRAGAVTVALREGIFHSLSARIAGLIVAATCTDVCFVDVLDDDGGALTLAGATSPFDAAVGRVRLLAGEGVSGWVARNSEPVTITDGKESDPRYRYFPSCAARSSPRWRRCRWPAARPGWWVC
jgi:hypothetical protein